MSNIKCPYCNKPLECKTTHISEVYVIDLYHCANQDCESTEYLVGCKEFWDILGQLIRTRKMLKIAVGTIETIKYSKKSDAINLRHKANKALIEIYKIKDQTALEQKERFANANKTIE